MNWFQTYTGRVIDLDKHPKHWPIDIADIAHALSSICRWSGHVRNFFSVAQHSFTMACQIDHKKWPKESMALLLHDASEAYLNDVISPLKRRLREGGRPSRYDVLEKKCQEAIAKTFGLPEDAFGTEQVKHYDMRMLMTEYRDLIPPLRDPESLPIDITDWAKHMVEPFERKIEPMDSDYAESMFLTKFLELAKLMKEKQGKTV